MKPSRSKRESRLVMVPVVAALVMLVAIGPARAQEPVTAEDMGWYTGLALSAGGVPVGDPVGNASFEQGDLPVGATGEGEHKRSYLRLGLPADATTVEVELPISEDPEKSFGQAGPILACPVTGPFAVKSGEDIESAPEVDCSVGIEGEPDADLAEGETATMYRFDLTPLLAQWEDAEAPGSFALVADVSEPQSPYQITLVAELFEEVGTAEVDGGSEAGPVVPSPTLPDSSGQPPSSSPDSAPSPSDPLTLPQPSGEPSSGQAEGAAPPEVAPPVDGTDGEGAPAPVTQEPAHEPAMALPTPAPVRVLPWVGGLLVAMAALGTAGRSLSPAVHPATSLDRILGP